MNGYTLEKVTGEIQDRDKETMALQPSIDAFDCSYFSSPAHLSDN
jgi:hypothetical protein